MSDHQHWPVPRWITAVLAILLAITHVVTIGLHLDEVWHAIASIAYLLALFVVLLCVTIFWRHLTPVWNAVGKLRNRALDYLSSATTGLRWYLERELATQILGMKFPAILD